MASGDRLPIGEIACGQLPSETAEKVSQKYRVERQLVKYVTVHSWAVRAAQRTFSVHCQIHCAIANCPLSQVKVA